MGPPNSSSFLGSPSQEGSSSQSVHSLVSSQAGRQASTPLPRDSTTSQEASTSSNNTPSGEGLSQVGNNPLTDLVPTQAGRQLGIQLGSGPPHRFPKGTALLLKQVVPVPRKVPLPPQ